jgi:hypothetical protein
LPAGDATRCVSRLPLNIFGHDLRY